MARQNRVTPMGAIIAHPARGMLMGNRGILHDAAGTLRRMHGHQSWICCLTDFRGRRRALMQPRRYTELFFLDEATALAAGHRPCAECRRADYRAFCAQWTAAHGPAPHGIPLPRQIDRALHAARIDSRGQRILHAARADRLPDGAMILTQDGPALIHQGQARLWSPEGYGAPTQLPACVQVITPAPLIAVLALGYRPGLHPSAG